MSSLPDLLPRLLPELEVDCQSFRRLAFLLQQIQLGRVLSRKPPLLKLPHLNIRWLDYLFATSSTPLRTTTPLLAATILFLTNWLISITLSPFGNELTNQTHSQHIQANDTYQPPKRNTHDGSLRYLIVVMVDCPCGDVQSILVWTHFCDDYSDYNLQHHFLVDYSAFC